MSATLTVTHKAIGAEVRRKPYDVLLDGELVGSVEMNGTLVVPIEPGEDVHLPPGRHPSDHVDLPQPRAGALHPPAEACGPGRRGLRGRGPRRGHADARGVEDVPDSVT